MPTAGIKVLFVGNKSWPIEGYQIEVCTKINHLLGQIAKFKPDVIVSSEFVPGALSLSGFEIRKRWLHIDSKSKPEDVTNAIESCYGSILWKEHPYAKDNPLISVYTPTYNTGDFLRDTYASLRDQKYVNWEWVVVDDGSTDGTWDRLKEMAAEDCRVRPMQVVHAGKIGLLKGMATKLAHGAFVVELDHDDMLTDNALEEVRKAFLDPEVGMVYSNCAAFFQNGTPQKYGGEFWESKYRETEYRGKVYTEARGPDIYDRFGPNYWQQFGWFLTVGPNHLRAYRKTKLEELGGYNPNLPVADDWDVYARFFLRSKCVWLDQMLYLYRFLDGYSNTTFTKNKSIQDHLEWGRRNYADEFDAFNKKRLNPAAPIQGKAATNTLLTVVVTSVAERLTTDLPRIMGELFKQAAGKPVEVLGDIDNRKVTISEKRNRAIRNAQGKFIAFVDDDDAVTPDYVDELVKAIQANPDANLVVFDELVKGYTKDGGPPTPENPSIDKLCRYGLEFSYRNAEDAYYRKPCNRAAWRTELARKVPPYQNIDAEDVRWGEAASEGLPLSSQARVNKVLYLYTFDPKTTLQKTQDKVVAEREKALAAPAAKPATPENLSVVIVDWNTKDKTLACVKSVRALYPEAEIVLVQNGEHFPCEMANKTVQLEMNIGYAAGVNRGVMEAAREYVCLLNSDTFVAQPKFFERLIGELAKDPTVGIVAPYSSYARPPQGNFAEKDCPQDSKDVPVVFVCVIFRKALFDELGGMDPTLCTFEDDDFVQKVLRKGLKSRVVGGVWINHEGHASFRKNGLDPFKVQDENQKKYIKKWPTVAVVAITKDEMGSLPGFFEQFKGAFNYGAILDSGSTDGTVEWAKKCGVRIGARDFTRFDEQRNEAAKLAHDAEWIIMLDPDERLDEHTIKCIPDLVRSYEFDIYLAPLRAENRDGSFTEWVGKPFLFRNKPEIQWALPVHEKLIGSKHQAMVKNGMITHVIKLHDQARRQKSEGFYAKLTQLPRQDVSAWPILDYEHRDHPSIEKIVIGPLVSIVIPSYNRLKMLTRAVESVKTQDYRPVEVVVVGDACPQLHNFAVEGNMRVVNLPTNHGAGGAVPRNYGIALATGRWIAYLDDDNFLKENHLSSLMNAAQVKGADFAFSSMETLGKKLVFDKPVKGKIDSSCLLHKKSLIEQFGWWKDRTTGTYAHDWEIVSRWVAAGVSWAATGEATLMYNAETSGQEAFLRELVGAPK